VPVAPSGLRSPRAAFNTRSLPRRRPNQALADFLRTSAAARGLPLTSVWVQRHTGVANAAPADAPTALLPGFEGPEGRGGCIVDSLCQLRFRVSPQAFFQASGGAAFPA
jgi:hypothetical protein